LPKQQERHLPALFISAVCTVLLVCAFVLPFLESDMDLSFPGWVSKADRLLPFFDIETKLEEWILGLTGVPLGRQYLFGIIRDLWASHEFLLAVIIFGFSAVFPVIKLSLSLVLSSGMPLTHKRRRKLQKFLELSSKWSMADVFIAAMVVVFFKAEGFQFEFAPQAGIYCFALAAIGSSVAVHLLKMQLAQSSESVGEEIGKIAEELRERGDDQSAKMADDLDSIRGRVEHAHAEA